jgi:hypothetical protein
MNLFTCVHEVLIDGGINGKVVERRVVGGTLQKIHQCCGSGTGSNGKVGSGSRILINLQITSQNVWNLSLF